MASEVDMTGMVDHATTSSTTIEVRVLDFATIHDWRAYKEGV
jgi:hypothetical protein